MRNRDVVFLLLIFFWLCVALGVLICNAVQMPESLGVNAGAIIYFILYLIAERNLPNFKNWSNIKL